MTSSHLDAAPRAWGELPRDVEHGVPIPFACGTEATSLAELDRRRVTQCALSRVCGVCGASLDRPLTLLGTRLEVDRNAFGFPPCHAGCASAMLSALRQVTGPALGQPADQEWLLVSTGGFDYLRPGRDDVEQRPVFVPNSRL